MDEFKRGELSSIARDSIKDRKVALAGVLKEAREREETVKSFIERRNRKQYGRG